jgi:hypothetical protein
MVAVILESRCVNQFARFFNAEENIGGVTAEDYYDAWLKLHPEPRPGAMFVEPCSMIRTWVSLI